MTVDQEQPQPDDTTHHTPGAAPHEPSKLAQLERRGRTTRERHPSDTARFVIALAVCLAFVAFARTNPTGVQGISTDLVLLFNPLPDLVIRLIVGLLQGAALVGPIGAIVYFRRGRLAELLLAAGAAVAAGLTAALLAGVLRYAAGVGAALSEPFAIAATSNAWSRVVWSA